jgi:hypothetical protein
MDRLKRRSLLALLALPTGCAIQYLPPLATSALSRSGPAGSVRAPALGQSWTYSQLNFYNSQRLDTVTEQVVSVDGGTRISRRSKNNTDLGDEFQPVWGQVKQDPYWDSLQTYESPMPLWLNSWTPGTRQVNDTHYQSGSASFRYWINTRTSLTAWEKVVLPCGAFEALRIDKFIRMSHQDISRIDTIRHDTLWFAPEVGRWVVRETSGEFTVSSGKKGGRSGREDRFRWQLESWT